LSFGFPIFFLCSRFFRFFSISCWAVRFTASLSFSRFFPIFTFFTAMHIHDEHISAYLDGQLGEDEKTEFERRLADDGDFRAQYRSLHAVKTLLQNRHIRLCKETPPAVRHSVLLALEQESRRLQVLDNIERDSRERAHKNDAISFGATSALPQAAGKGAKDSGALKPPFGSPSRRGVLTAVHFLQERPLALVAALACILIGWLSVRLAVQPDASTLPRAAAQAGLYSSVFVEESIQNYQAVSAGKIGLQCKTESFDTLEAFFRRNGIQYHLVLPKINARLLGGVVSEERGAKSAHLVFQHNDRLLYMWEINLDDNAVQHVNIKSEVWSDLHKGEWLWHTEAGAPATVVFWEDRKEGKRTLCSVVASMPRAELQSLFQ
jgi:anti-sigma factor RsiW